MLCRGEGDGLVARAHSITLASTRVAGGTRTALALSTHKGPAGTWSSGEPSSAGPVARQGSVELEPSPAAAPLEQELIVLL